MSYNGNKKLTAAQLAALEARVVTDIEGDISDDIRALVQDDLDKTTAGALDNRITVLENAMPITSIDSFTKLKAIVAAGHAAGAVTIGEQLITDWRDGSNGNKLYEVAQNVCHISASETFSDDGGATEVTSPGLFMQWHYAPPYDMPFDAREALYVAPEGGLPAGTYYFRVTGIVSGWGSYANNNNKTFMFTLTDDLAEGQMLMLSAAYDTATWVGTYIRVYDSGYAKKMNTSYGTDGNMVLSEWDGASGDPLTGNASSYSTGANGLNHIQRVLLGYNRWSQSAIRQWLNSAAPARVEGDEENYPGWWSPQNAFDRIPSQAITYITTSGTTNTGRPGFLSGYDADFIAAMRPVKVATSTNTVTDGGATEYTYDKVFLPSLTQMNIAPQVAEGTTWDYYKQLFAANPVEGRTNWAQNSTYPILKGYGINAKSTAVYVRLRSASRSGASYAWNFGTSGNVTYNSASGAYRARPACVIG